MLLLVAERVMRGIGQDDAPRDLICKAHKAVKGHMDGDAGDVIAVKAGRIDARFLAPVARVVPLDISFCSFVHGATKVLCLAERDVATLRNKEWKLLFPHPIVKVKVEQGAIHIKDAILNFSPWKLGHVILLCVVPMQCSRALSFIQ